MKLPIALCVLASLCAVSSALAQGAATATPQGDTWESIKLLPDWKGQWRAVKGGAGGSSSLNDTTMKMTERLLGYKNRNEALTKAGGDKEGRAKYCIPLGIPGGMAGPISLHDFLFVPGRVILTDVNAWYRVFYTDGRPHHKGPETMSGDSVGHWEGSGPTMTLVVDTINLHHGNEFNYGVPGGKDVRLIERFHLLEDGETMILDSIMEAPESFTEPYSFQITFAKREWQMLEFDCEQNERSIGTKGEQIFEIKLPELDGPNLMQPIPKRSRGYRKYCIEKCPN